MEVLQQTTPSMPQQSTSLNVCPKRVCCQGGGQGSPIPGDPASPLGSFQQSPPLFASGLTEFIASDSLPGNDSPVELQDLPASKGPLCNTSAPRRQYVGVRVKMPVCELLKKIRLSRGIESENSQEPSPRAGLPKTSGTTGKKKVPPGKRHKQSRLQTPAAVKSVEDLDILVEVLQEDLHQSCAKLDGRLDGEAGHHGGLPERWAPLEEVESRPLPDSEDLYPDCRIKQLDVSNTHQNLNMKSGGCQGPTIQRWVESLQDTHLLACPKSLPGPVEPVLAEPEAASVLHNGRCSNPGSGAFMRQEASSLSFFQFQLCHEQSSFTKIPLDKLLVTDKNGDRWFDFPLDNTKR